MNEKYLENIKRGQVQLATEQANVLVVSERVHLERLTKIILGAPVTGTDHKHPDIVEAEARVRACKKYIENNIIALAFSGFYGKADIVRALERWDIGSREKSGGDHVHARVDIGAALATLSPREHAAVVLRYTRGKPVSQIAEYLGTSRYHTNNALDAGITNLCVALNGPIVQQIERTYANFMLHHSLDLFDLYMSVSSSSQDALDFALTAEEWSTTLALPGPQRLLDLVDEYQLEEEAA